MGAETGTTVLVVDDEQSVTDAYAAQLEGEYNVLTAYGGEDAIEMVTTAVDVALLDRRMPRVSGDEVLDEIHAQGIDCRVIMVTAVDPDFDIVDMPFEDYLQKPVDKAELVSAIERQLEAREYDERFDEFLELNTKIGLLEEQKQRQELENSAELQEIKQRAESLKSELDRTVMGFEESETAFQDLV